MPMTTLADLAARAGVSVTTVSRALRDMPDIGVATKLRIRQLADELGYRPNHAARALASNRSQIIGLGMETRSNPYFEELGLGVVRAARELGWRTLLVEVREDPQTGRPRLELPAAGLIDGVLLFEGWYSRPFDAGQLHALEQSGVKVLFRGTPAAPDIDHVQIDWQEGAYQATRYLLDLRHRRIGVLRGVGSEAEVESGRRHDKLAGTEQALSEAGLALDPSLVRVFPSRLAAARTAALEVLDQPARPTALICHDDVLALGALRAATELGLRVPTDLSIVGFNDTEIGRYLPVALTTVGFEIAPVARELVRLLIDRVEGRREPASLRSTERLRLIVRESTGPAPA
ncbi:MAG: LacI family DNA-binding transcriptional regulator [Chloroflexota bacterium]